MASGRLIDYLGRGILADRPVTPDLAPGGLGFYFAEDTSELYAWDGSVWVLVTSGSGGAGDVVGPSSSADSAIVLFDGTTGKLIKDSSRTVASLRVPSEQSVVSSATVTPTFLDDIVVITAQAVNLTVANPTGTAIPNLGIVIRIKDNGTSRTISWGSQYRSIGVELPTATVVGKTTYVAAVFNVADTKWDVLAVGTES